MNIKYGSVASPGEITDENNQQNKERKERLPCMLYIVCLIITLHVFSDNLWDVVMNQYAYVAFRKMDFPNMSISNTAKDKSKSDRETNNSLYNIDDRIQEDVSRWSVYMSLASGLHMVISAPLISAMSDRYGRKYFFLIPLFANILKNAMTAVGVVFDLKINLFSIFLFVDAVNGSWIATVALGSAYIADITTCKNRSFAIAVLGISIGAGLMLSIFVSGYLISWFGFAVPLVVASACTITAIILVCCCVAESLRERYRAEGARPLRQLRAALDFYITKEATSKGKRWKFIIYITAFTLISLGIFGRKNIEIFYLIGLPFCWNSVQISNFGTVRTIVQDVFGLIMIRVFQCCISDFWIAIIGTISAVGYFIIVGLSNNSLHLYMAVVIGSLGGIETSMLKALISQMAPADKQGAVFASVAFSENLCYMTGTSVSAAIYSATVNVFGGFAFLVMAGFGVVSLILLLASYFISGPNSSSYQELEVKCPEEVQRREA